MIEKPIPNVQVVAIQWHTATNLLAVDQTSNALGFVAILAHCTRCGGANFTFVGGVEMVCSTCPPVAVERNQTCNNKNVISKTHQVKYFTLFTTTSCLV